MLESLSTNDRVALVRPLPLTPSDTLVLIEYSAVFDWLKDDAFYESMDTIGFFQLWWILVPGVPFVGNILEKYSALQK